MHQALAAIELVAFDRLLARVKAQGSAANLADARTQPAVAGVRSGLDGVG